MPSICIFFQTLRHPFSSLATFWFSLTAGFSHSLYWSICIFAGPWNELHFLLQMKHALVLLISVETESWSRMNQLHHYLYYFIFYLGIWSKQDRMNIKCVSWRKAHLNFACIHDDLNVSALCSNGIILQEFKFKEDNKTHSNTQHSFTLLP